MRSALVYFQDRLAGRLTDNDYEFSFAYDADYLKDGFPISLTLPLQKDPFVSKTLFSFFDGLIPEGWLLNVASRNWKVNPNDRMGLLLICCQDTIGAVSIKKEENP